MSINNLRVFALIPARGGSKEIPKKNMRMLNGKPLVGFTIEAAQKSKYINNIYISSDDSKTLEYANNFGIKTLRRPAKYSDDKATANDVIAHFLLNNSHIENNDYILYLQPTSPLRTSFDIDKAIELVDSPNCEGVVSVMIMEKSPYKSFILDKSGKLQSLFDEIKTNTSRQNLPIVYLPNGAIYLFKVSKFKLNNTIPSNGSKPYVMSENLSIDVDTEADLINLDKILSN